MTKRKYLYLVIYTVLISIGYKIIDLLGLFWGDLLFFIIYLLVGGDSTDTYLLRTYHTDLEDMIINPIRYVVDATPWIVLVFFLIKEMRRKRKSN